MSKKQRTGEIWGICERTDKMIDIEGFRKYLIQRGLSKYSIQKYCISLKQYSEKSSEITEEDLAAYVLSLYDSGIKSSSIERKKTVLRAYCGFIGVPIGETLRKKQGGSRIHKKTELDQKPKPTPKKTLEEVVLDVEQYNKQHGTRLSYGQYKVLQRQGRI